MKIILASDSKQDKEILDLTVLDYETLTPAKGGTRTPKNVDPKKYVKEVAKKKTTNIIKDYDLKEGNVVGVYSVIVLDGKILKRPQKEKDAENILKKLSGKTHTVLTGICVVNPEKKKTRTEVASTRVKFYDLSKHEIGEYIKTREYVDTIGGYDVRGRGGVFIDSINGDYFNLSGLPINKIRKMLKK